MEDLTKTREVVNDLIRINNDRIEGYEKAIKELPEGNADLKNLFSGFISQSRELKSELQTYSGPLDEDAGNETTTAGKVYRGWMGVKQTFAMDDRKAVLESCEFGEDAAQKAYSDAEMEDQVSAAVKAMIMQQKRELRRSHDEVKKLRDLE